jgi:type II secretory pathway component PulM
VKDLPEGLERRYRSSVKRFLVHLEEQGQSWSQLVPAGSGPGARPAALEQAVSEGMWHHGLQSNTRAAINQAFGFKLQGDRKKTPDLQEHKALLKDLPKELGQAYRSSVNLFLVHLEEQGKSWSQLVPAGSGPDARPAALEQAVNKGIWQQGVQTNTRAAINQAFGFKLQGSIKAPELQEHKDLLRDVLKDMLKDVPEGLGHAYRSNVKQFLAHLEEQGKSWSQLVPAGSGPGARPAALEQAVNEGIRHHGLHSSTRAAINQAFGFKLQSKAGE